MGLPLTQRLSADAGRFIVTGGQLSLLFIGAKIDSPRAWLWIGTAIALLSLFAWMAALRRVRAITDTPTSRIATAAQGYVELNGKGKALAGLPVRSPLNGLPCLWYRFIAEQKDNAGRWSQQRNETSDASFIITDASGECLIDPEGAEIVSKRKDVWVEGNQRYTQWLLLEPEIIYVLGEFKTRSALELTQDRDADIKSLLSSWKEDPQRLLKRFDLNQDGSLDLREWELARSAARREVEANHRTLRGAADLNLMHYPRDGRLFLITNLSPEQLARRYRWWSWAHLLVFFGALAVVAHFLQQHY